MKELKIMNEVSIDGKVDFICKTYGMIILCIISASLSSYLSLWLSFPLDHPWMMLAALIIGVMVVQKLRKIPVINILSLISFGAITGMSIAALINVASQGSSMAVVQAFITTGIAFVALTIYVFISKVNFSFLKGFVVTGIISIISISLLNYFVFESSLVQMLTSSFGILLFSAMILYDTSNIIRDYEDDEYISAALTLYINVFLLFQNILYFFGMPKD